MTNFNRGIRIEFEGAEVEPITDLRVIFDASRSDGTKLNKLNLTIFNMKPASREAILIARPKDNLSDEPVIKVRLFAGYEGDLKQLIEGDIYISKSTKTGADWITDIEIWSGLTEASKATVSFNLDGKIPAKTISDRLVESLNIPVNYTQNALDILRDKTYTDFSESGMSIITIKRFLRRYDLDFTFEGDVGSIGRSGEANDEAVGQNTDNLFDLNNGLIGSPVITRTGVDFLSLLRPDINVLQKVFVRSKTINETLQNDENAVNEYVVRGMRHFGDTHEDEWFTEISSTYADIIQ